MLFPWSHQDVAPYRLTRLHTYFWSSKSQNPTGTPVWCLYGSHTGPAWEIFIFFISYGTHMGPVWDPTRVPYDTPMDTLVIWHNQQEHIGTCNTTWSAWISIQEQRWMPFSEVQMAKWPSRSRSMPPTFNTSLEYPRVHIWCKFVDFR